MAWSRFLTTLRLRRSADVDAVLVGVGDVVLTRCLPISSAARFQTSRAGLPGSGPWAEGLLEHRDADLDLLDRGVLDNRVAPVLVLLLVGDELVGQRLPSGGTGSCARRRRAGSAVPAVGLGGLRVRRGAGAWCSAHPACGGPGLLDLLVDLTYALSLFSGVLHELGVRFFGLSSRISRTSRVSRCLDTATARRRLPSASRRLRLGRWTVPDEPGHRTVDCRTDTTGDCCCGWAAAGSTSSDFGSTESRPARDSARLLGGWSRYARRLRVEAVI